jgi:hypothetical protein
LETVSIYDLDLALQGRPSAEASPARAAKKRFKLSGSSKGSFIGVGDWSNADG